MRSLSTTLARLAVAGTLLLAPGLARAADPPATTAVRSASTSARPSLAPDTFDALARDEDESLAKHRASGERWTDGEVILVVLLLIFVFPVGLIVLIVLLIVKS